ncbi:MAG: hypothetical protein AAFV38_13065, partial [Pseudomonadota bacterium]
MGPVLGEGWQDLPDQTHVMHGPSADLWLSAVGPLNTLILDVEPLDPLVADRNLILAITVNNSPQQSVQLAGRAQVEVPLGFIPNSDHGLCIELHAAVRGSDDPDGEPHGGILLWAVEVPHEPTTMTSRPIASRPPSGLAAKLATARRALSSGDAKLPLLRDALLQVISGTSPKALPSLLSAQDLETLVAVGESAPPRGGAVIVDDWFSGLAIAMLSGPACLTLPEITLAELPDFPKEVAKIVGAYLAASPSDGGAHLIRLLNEARRDFASQSVGSAQWTLAHAMLGKGLRHSRGNTSLALPYGQALEAMLLREGHNLHLSGRPKPSTGNPRVGMLVHHWDRYSLLPLIDALYDAQNEPLIFVLDLHEPADVIDLTGQTVANAVAQIRQADLDVLVLAANPSDDLHLASVAAHRLAPLQIALAPYCAGSTGLSNVDQFVTSEAGLATKALFTEKVVAAPGLGCPADLTPEPALDRHQSALVRRYLGATPDEFLLTTSIGELGPEIDLWIQILQEIPQIKLLVCAREQAGLRGLIDAALAKANLSPTRVHVTHVSSASGMSKLLATSNLVLYSPGDDAATLSALRLGVPVIAQPGSSQSMNYGAAILRSLGLDQLIMNSGAQVVAKIKSYIQNPDQHSDPWIACAWFGATGQVQIVS